MLRWCVNCRLLCVVLCRGSRPFYNLEDIRGDEIKPPQHLHTRTVSVEQLSMLYELFQFEFGKLHKPVDLVLGAVEVLKTEGVDRHDLDAALVADLQNLRDQSVSIGGKLRG
jgi:hypothetical protein